MIFAFFDRVFIWALRGKSSKICTFGLLAFIAAKNTTAHTLMLVNFFQALVEKTLTQSQLLHRRHNIPFGRLWQAILVAIWLNANQNVLFDWDSQTGPQIIDIFVGLLGHYHMSTREFCRFRHKRIWLGNPWICFPLFLAFWTSEGVLIEAERKSTVLVLIH